MNTEQVGQSVSLMTKTARRCPQTKMQLSFVPAALIGQPHPLPQMSTLGHVSYSFVVGSMVI